MLQLSRRAAPPGFVEPCLPSRAERPPSWIHEIKHDGYRLMARRDPAGVCLLTRNGHDWAARYPLILEAVNRLKVRSCLIDGEAVACDKSGLAVLERLRRNPSGKHVFLYALRPPRAGRPRPVARTAEDAQADTREPAAREPSRAAPELSPVLRWRPKRTPEMVNQVTYQYCIDPEGDEE